MTNTEPPQCAQCGPSIVPHWTAQHCDACNIIVHNRKALDYWADDRGVDWVLCAACMRLDAERVSR